VGAHANVGGGYPSDELAQIPLRWLASKAEALGLALRETIDVDDGAELAAVVDSYASFLLGAYRLSSQRFSRPIGTPEVQVDGYWVATINETIDASVFQRWKSDPGYRPEGIKAWAARIGFDIDTASDDVRADDPRLPMKR
jgi:hypothetical protein